MGNKNDNDFLKIGYKAGVVLSFLCITAAAIYMFLFLANSPNPASVRDELGLLSITAERRLLLLSTAMFIAMAFGFLGFALFLIQAKGEVETEGSFSDYKFKFATISPGLFVILCSTVIIVFAVTFRIDYGMQRAGQTEVPTLDTTISMQADATDDELNIQGRQKRDSLNRKDSVSGKKSDTLDRKKSDSGKKTTRKPK